MNLVELDRALRKLRLSGMADVLETRLRHAQSEKMAPLDTVSVLVCDELQRRQDRLFERRTKQARFRDPDRALDSFDFDFNRKMNRALVYELATGPLRRPARGRPLPRPARHRQEPPRPGHRPRRHPPGLPRPLPRGPRPHRGDRRCDDRRHPQGLLRRPRDRASAHHRRHRHAQAAEHRRRGPPRGRHAPLRAGLHAAHLATVPSTTGESSSETPPP